MAGLRAVPGQRNGAEDGTRTRDPHLGKVMLYQLSHFRSMTRPPGWWCREPESNWRHRDFQSRALPTELSRPDGQPGLVARRRPENTTGPESPTRRGAGPRRSASPVPWRLCPRFRGAPDGRPAPLARPVPGRSRGPSRRSLPANIGGPKELADTAVRCATQASRTDVRSWRTIGFRGADMRSQRAQIFAAGECPAGWSLPAPDRPSRASRAPPTPRGPPRRAVARPSARGCG